MTGADRKDSEFADANGRKGSGNHSERKGHMIYWVKRGIDKNDGNVRVVCRCIKRFLNLVWTQS